MKEKGNIITLKTLNDCSMGVEVLLTSEMDELEGELIWVLSIATRKYKEIMGDLQTIREKLLSKHSKAEVDGRPFNGGTDKEGKEAFFAELKPVLDKPADIVLPKIKFDVIKKMKYKDKRGRFCTYNPDIIGDLIEIGVVEK